ncbi:MAG: signal recognition particle-docking protein FtsY [Actinobacteria bacterium]|nr:signal recognition particle-docking protein FtsY [Actinomycetota bacterium]MDA2961480.1 signal recognition particle-docking protein FtsY [Actinomycetota bacterium]MDA2993992.1 signal recognition particle-docking protein FtsY [Actinomycetota bacterium]
MDQNNWIYLVLILLVVGFGAGVIIAGRRRSGSEAPIPDSRTAGADASKHESAVTAVADEPAEAEPFAETSVEESDDAPDLAVGTDDAVDEREVARDDPEQPKSMRDRLARARGAFSEAVGSVLGRSGIDDAVWEELEDALLIADVGIGVATSLLEPLRDRVTKGEIENPEQLIAALRVSMVTQLEGANRELSMRDDDGTSIWLFVGVNGVGKTTTIGKLASRQIASGTKVLLSAGDTFRAAAADQLQMWAERSGAEIVRGADGADPSSVVFDAVERATAKEFDLVLADTAGRLHNKQNLMDELSKVRRVAEKGSGVVTETLLVIDATTGQNGLAQAREFAAATGVTGVVVTKLDGSAKGGIVFAVETELGIPVKFVGVGEQINDLVPFDPQEFVDALVSV